MVAYWSCTFAFSTAALSASTVAFSAATAVLRGIHLLARRDASLAEVLEALGLLRGVGGLREVALEVGLRLLQRRFERPPIQREQDLPGRDVVAFGEVDAGQLAGGLRADRHGRERLGRADDADLDRHRLLNDRANRDGNRRRAAPAAPPVSGSRRCSGALFARTAGDDELDKRKQNDGRVRMRPMSPSRYSMILVEPRALVDWIGARRWRAGTAIR